MIQRSPTPLLRSLSRRLVSTNAAQNAIIAVGSNVGNRAQHIHEAVEKLSNICEVHRTSFLYESKPMYVLDQPEFLNGVVEVRTSLPPLQLLHNLRTIEHKLGRSFTGVRYGPRPIDLDIICYGTQRIHEGEELIVPHVRLHEREFVLRPLCDISRSFPIPFEDRTRTAEELLNELLPDGKSELRKVTPTHTGRLLLWGEKTLLMGIINVTPDSFSDGGQHDTVEKALKQVEAFCAHGFDIVDIGGQSTRPGAELVGAEEELRRILPIIEAVRRSFPEVVISCDTFLSEVAEQVLDAGVELINDISAGTLDKTLHETLARRNAACVQMHTRGTPETMTDLQSYEHVTEEVSQELSQNMEAAQTAGIKRWSMICDPGIGFAKKRNHSIQLLRENRRFRVLTGNYPVLLGPSRKSWLSNIPMVDTRASRDWATAGAVSCCIGRGGVDIVRIHEPKVADAVRAADTIARGL